MPDHVEREIADALLLREADRVGFRFAGLPTIILIGLLVESVEFRVIEVRIVQHWAMHG